MKILQVIHGYPLRYNAGSEVYTQSLCHGLAERHDVHVFTREEDPFGPDFRVRTETDPDNPRITLHLINNPRSRDRYRHSGIDGAFAALLDQLQPEIVHIGHLNHLSTSMIAEAAARDIPIVYTLHDYWIMCPRGQFMQMHPADPADLWTACEGQDDRNCAQRCYARYFSGAPEDHEQEVQHWTNWVSRRMAHIRAMADKVDLFIAPAQYLKRRYLEGFALDPAKVTYLDYGFPLNRLAGRKRTQGEPFTFGYIGTHIPAKGVQHLIAAFGRLSGDVRLRIWGRPRGQETEALKALACSLPNGAGSRIEWLAEYRNQNIVGDVFNRVDAIVVPSIWVENSPLVIHEALQARVPVITANVGGMAEYIAHDVNGLLFEHRSPSSLAAQMQRLAEDPSLAQRLGQRGYLQSPTGDVPALDDHVQAIEAIYETLIERRRAVVPPGPWRITFDTNPDTCNLRCTMCEEHSLHAVGKGRKPKRLMPIEVLRRVVAEAAPRGLSEIIPSTMGEPLLYEQFDDILDICREYGIRLNLTTNGTFPRRGAEGWAERIVPLASDIKISWNGASPETHKAIMHGSRWDKALDNARRFIAVRDRHAKEGGNRCRVTFQLTFMEENVAELADIVRLAATLGVDRVKGHHLWVHFPEIADQSMRRSPAAIARWNAAVSNTHAAAERFHRADGHKVLLENIFPLAPEAAEDLAPGGSCPFLGREAWINAAGRFDPCCAPDAQRRTLGEFGMIDDSGFLKIWNGASYRNLVKTYQDRALCRSCNMRRPPEQAA